MTNLPIIRLEVERMRHSIVAMLTEAELKIDQNIQQALDAYCTPENLTRVITQELKQTLDSVIKEEVKNFFTYGEGRKVVKAAVIKKLEENTTYTVLDEV